MRVRANYAHALGDTQKPERCAGKIRDSISFKAHFIFVDKDAESSAQNSPIILQDRPSSQQVIDNLKTMRRNAPPLSSLSLATFHHGHVLSTRCNTTRISLARYSRLSIMSISSRAPSKPTRMRKRALPPSSTSLPERAPSSRCSFTFLGPLHFPYAKKAPELDAPTPSAAYMRACAT